MKIIRIDVAFRRSNLDIRSTVAGSPRRQVRGFAGVLDQVIEFARLARLYQLEPSVENQPPVGQGGKNVAPGRRGWVGQLFPQRLRIPLWRNFRSGEIDERGRQVQYRRRGVDDGPPRAPGPEMASGTAIDP